MKLSKIILENFKNQSKIVHLSDDGIVAIGRQGTGKTTIIDAVCWCLFGKFSNRQEATGKPLDTDNKVIGVEVAVELVTDIGTFKRTLSENWVTPRGMTKAKLQGHTINYYLDGLPCKAGEYERAVNKNFSEEQFYVTAIPSYFGTDDGSRWNWQKRRKILSDMAGMPTNQELIEREPELAEILVDEDNTYYERKLLSLKNQYKSLNDNLKTIPVRKDEVSKNIVSINTSLEDLKAERVSLSSEREKVLQNASTELQDMLDDLLRQESELRTIKSVKLRELSDKYQKFIEMSIDLEKIEKTKSQINTLVAENAKIKETIETLNNNVATSERLVGNSEQIISRAEASLKEATAVKSKLEKQMKEIKPETTVCFNCNQKLPQEMIENGIEYQKASIAKEIEDINKSIEARQSEINEHQAKIANIKSTIASQKTGISEHEKLSADITEKLTSLIDILEVFRQSNKEVEEGLNAQRKEEQDKLISEIDEEIAEVKEQWNSTKQRLDEAKPDTTEIDEKIAEVEAKINIMNNNFLSRKRIEELDNQMQELAIALEETERLISLYERRLTVWATMIDERVSSYFQTAKFKLFEANMTNDGIKETCIVLYNGRATMSTGEGILVGTDIAETLAHHWNITPPLMVDGIQNITVELPSDRQKILTLTLDQDIQIKQL